MGKASRSQHAPLAQLDRASVYGTEGWGFDSLEARFGKLLNSIKLQLFLLLCTEQTILVWACIGVFRRADNREQTHLGWALV